jgi:hypothetical protein
VVALTDGVLTKRNLVRPRIHGEKRFLSMMKTRSDGDEVKGIVGKIKRSLTLKVNYAYHIMNNTYIHMRVKGSEYIHVQEGENI